MFGLPFKKPFGLVSLLFCLISAVTGFSQRSTCLFKTSPTNSNPFREVTIKTNGGTVSPTPS